MQSSFYSPYTPVHTWTPDLPPSPRSLLPYCSLYLPPLITDFILIKPNSQNKALHIKKIKNTQNDSRHVFVCETSHSSRSSDNTQLWQPVDLPVRCWIPGAGLKLNSGKFLHPSSFHSPIKRLLLLCLSSIICRRLLLPSLAQCQRWSQGPVCPPLSLSC